MKVEEIIEAADGLAPNRFGDEQKIGWLNDINNEFFEVVKIPKVVHLNITKAKADYTLSRAVTMRNIDRVVAGTQTYKSLQLDDVPPGRAGWTYDDADCVLSLEPAPSYDCKGYVRHMQVPLTPFVIADPEAQTPEAPAAYHEAYVFGLAEKMALALDDIIKATNYGLQYRAKLSIAQANYQRGG